MSNTTDRRTFVKTTTAAGLGLGLSQMAGPLHGAHHKSAMNTVRVAAVGTNSRGNQLTKLFSQVPGVKITHVCDPDDRAIAKGMKTAEAFGQATPKGVKDFRTLLDGDQIDALFMATPDHWHAPGAIMAMQAGKHVYLEKPISHNPAEGEMVIRAERRSGVVFQMGNQRRSGEIYFQAKEEIQNGVIGKPYRAHTFYANNRGPIGRGRHAAIPAHLDYEVWQGPAPRRLFRDNVIHYNWHWFKNWGTGEANNNATHEVDVARWLMGLSIPSRVSSAGGRFHYDDDWEFFDTQDVNWEFPQGAMITWSGRSCNPRRIEGKGRGVIIQGSEGSMEIDAGYYTLYDLKDKIVKTEQLAGDVIDGGGTDTVAPTADLTYAHALNFIEAIRGKAKANSPAREGHLSNLLCHLGNISQFLGRSLAIDPSTGHIVNDPQAMASWEREYEPGWKPEV